jgi:hypothetical protein
MTPPPVVEGVIRGGAPDDAVPVPNYVRRRFKRLYASLEIALSSERE